MKKAVFVLGAGASVPYGYPSGQGLIERILNPQGDVVELLRSVGLESGSWSELQTSLLHSAQPSIDTFLERRPDYLSVGKMLIAANILMCEKADRFYRENNDNWYPLLLKLFDGPFDSLDFSSVTIVTFNYDRSLEQFLHQALCHRYKKSDKGVSVVLRTFKVIHVYGQVGLLHWEGGRRYASPPSAGELKAAADGIKIISECDNDLPELCEARKAIESATVVFCMGMAYHHDNMRRLGFPIRAPIVGGRHVNGSAYLLTDAEAKEVERRYAMTRLGHISHRCVEFLRNSQSFLQLKDS